MPSTLADHGIQRPPDGEEPQFITESLPNADVADTGSEEVQIETGISIAEPQILRILGLVHTGTQNAFGDALADNAASQTQLFTLNVQTRGGEQFHTADPETIMRGDWVYRIVSDGANTQAVAHLPEATPVEDGGQLIGTPRIVLRQDNDLGQTVSADEYQVRMGYVFEDVTTNTFLQLVEKHADIFIG